MLCCVTFWNDGTVSKLHQVVAELHAAKEEIQKWKEEAQANQSHMLQVIILLLRT